MRFRALIVVAAVASCVACQRTTKENTTVPSKPDRASIEEVAVGPGGETANAVAASNRFGLAFYRELASQSGNLAYSPASLSVALAMTYAGARGDTAKEMRATLALPEPADSVHAGWTSLIHGWQNVGEGAEIAVANRLFGDKQYTFEPAFLKLTGSRYGAPLEPVDFAGAPEVQRKRINDWVEQKTRTRIRELIPPPMDPEARLALVNAMYFKAKWLAPFNEHATADGDFTTAAGTKVQVPMMSQVEHMGYGEVDGVQVAQRKYENTRFAAVFVLPEKGKSLADLEAKLDDALLGQWLGALQDQRVAMKLPRFTIDPPSSWELKDLLKKLGMHLPFERLKADFTGIANPASPEDRLYISKVFHKAFVAMDEAGTEAAAATAVVMARAGGPPPAEPKSFVADRPFLFFIRDLDTDLVMFAGRVVDPSA